MSKKAAPALKKANIFIPLRKVDEVQQLVYGTITKEVLDQAGEIMDYETSKPLFEKWSSDIHTASNGLSKGNVRVMHGNIAAGKLTELDFDDAEQEIEVCAKIVDAAEWEKVVEGVYTGFSVGGAYEKKWTDPTNPLIKRFTARPLEVSLVDNPCVKEATFSLIKADGLEEDVMFKNATLEPEAVEEETATVEEPGLDFTPPTNTEIAAKATELADLAKDGSTWVDHIDPAREELMKAAPKNKEKKATVDAKSDEEKTAVESQTDADAKASQEDKDKKANKSAVASRDKLKQVQKWTTTDDQSFDKKADAEAHQEVLDKAAAVPLSPAEKLLKALADARQVVEDKENGVVPPAPVTVFEDFDRLHKAVLVLEEPMMEDGSPALEKGMYTVSRFADMLSSAASLARTIKQEGGVEADSDDDSTAKAILSSLSDFGGVFIKYAQEQVAEMIAGMDTDVASSCCSYYCRMAEAEPDNVLAKDVASLFELVADDLPAAMEKMAKFAEVEAVDETQFVPMAKFVKLEADNEALSKAALQAVEEVGALVKRVTVLEDTPLPRAPANIVEKGGSEFFGKTVVTEEDKMGVLDDLLKKYTPDQLAMRMIKMSHDHPQTLMAKPA